MSKNLIGNEGTKLIVTLAVIFVAAAALVTLPFQNQIANAAPSPKKFQVYVTLTDVPANAEDLEVNATMAKNGGCCYSNFPVQTVSSPTNGDTVKFVLTLRTDINTDGVNGVYVCGNTFDFSVSNCKLYPLSKVVSPIRLEFPYPNCVGCG